MNSQPKVQQSITQCESPEYPHLASAAYGSMLVWAQAWLSELWGRPFEEQQDQAQLAL